MPKITQEQMEEVASQMKALRGEAAFVPNEGHEATVSDVMEYTAALLALKYDLNERTMYLMTELTSEIAAQFIIILHFMDSISHDPIRIILSSPGGEEEAGYAIYDAIKLAKSPVLIDGIGMVASMAAVVIQAGDVRRLSQNTVLMIHNGSMSLPDHMEQDKVMAVSRLIETNKVKYHTLLANRSGISIKEISKMSEEETFLNATDAVRMGFADYLWLPKKKKTAKLLKQWVEGFK